MCHNLPNTRKLCCDCDCEIVISLSLNINKNSGIMDNKPSLSQYFGDTNTPPASQFFDEIGTSPADMIQSVYLGDSEGAPTTAANLFPQNMTTSFTHQKTSDEVTFSNVLPTVSGTSAVPAASLPDPSTFFDTIGPEPSIGNAKSSIASPHILTEAMDGLSVKNQPVDKEADRRRDAWIPNEEAKKTLMKAQSSPKGSFFPDREVLTMPGIVLEEELGDALQEVSVQHLGVGVSGARGALRAEHVSRDAAGLRDLLRTGHMRAALNLTTALLGDAQQGAGRMQRPSKHTARTLQLWLTRFAVMQRIKLLEPLLREAEPFGDFGKPDMYYQFYPDSYSGRSGSLVPFSLRLLVAELPQHAGRPEDALDRLYGVLQVIQEMLANLREGKTEDGTRTLISEQDKLESVRLWSGRETRVWHSVVNCAIAMKDYRHASGVLARLEAAAATPVQRRALRSALGRLWLLAGHVPRALACFERARDERHHICPTADVRELLDLGLAEVALGRPQEACGHFARAADQDPTNLTAANNLAVCLLYTGRLQDAVAVLTRPLQADPARALADPLLLNLCTLYELQSSDTHGRKLDLLRSLCKHGTDCSPSVADCLKLRAPAAAALAAFNK